MNHLICSLALLCLLTPYSLTLPTDVSSSDSTEAVLGDSDISLDDLLDTISESEAIVDEKAVTHNTEEPMESELEKETIDDASSDGTPKDVLIVPEEDSNKLSEIKSRSRSFQSSGIITRVGHKGPFNCKSLVCPEGTQTCEYTSTLLEDGNLQMNYKCLSKDGDILLEETKTEPASMESDFGEFEMDGFFDRMNQVMNNVFYNPFKWIL